jgi:hypothetical protein
MKRFVLAGLAMLPMLGAAAPFRNLGFDDADLSLLSHAPGSLRSAVGDFALPGWSGGTDFSAPHSLGIVGADSLFPVLPYNVYSTNIYEDGITTVPIEGRNSVIMYSEQSRPGVPNQILFLAQTGDVPADAKLVHFLNYDNPLALWINGTEMALTAIPRVDTPVPESDVYADVSAFSGQTVQLLFQVTALGDAAGTYGFGLDSISFVVPEPPPTILWGIGGVGLAGFWMLRKRRHRSDSTARKYMPVIFAALLPIAGSASPFQNLGFDNANTNNLIGGMWGTPGDLTPAWTASLSWSRNLNHGRCSSWAELSMRWLS